VSRRRFKLEIQALSSTLYEGRQAAFDFSYSAGNLLLSAAFYY
jgi:hypothetical protein